MDECIVQEYIREPYLIDQFKFGKLRSTLHIHITVSPFRYPGLRVGNIV
jgi:hypothetical protein